MLVRYLPGDSVRVAGCGADGIVTALTIHSEDYVLYEVTYWQENENQCRDFRVFELEPAEKNHEQSNVSKRKDAKQ